jgi:hypothetical protein
VRHKSIDAWRDSLQKPFALACVLSSQINAADARHKDQEQKAAATRSAAIERKAFDSRKKHQKVLDSRKKHNPSGDCETRVGVSRHCVIVIVIVCVLCNSNVHCHWMV